MSGPVIATRIGHYHVPGTGQGYCHVALVVAVNDDRSVNLACWQRDAESYRRQDVPVSAPRIDATGEGGATFHPTTACPFGLVDEASEAGG